MDTRSSLIIAVIFFEFPKYSFFEKIRNLFVGSANCL